LAVDALSAGLCGRETVRQTGQADPQPQDDISISRPSSRTQQRVRLGATPEGKLVSLQHDYVYERSMLDNYHEDCGEATAFHYSVPKLRVKFGRAKRHIGHAVRICAAPALCPDFTPPNRP